MKMLMSKNAKGRDEGEIVWWQWWCGGGGGGGGGEGGRRGEGGGKEGEERNWRSAPSINHIEGDQGPVQEYQCVRGLKIA